MTTWDWLGLDSLSIFNLEASLSKEFKVSVDFRKHMGEEPTVRYVVEHIRSLQAKKQSGA